jgi:hypothetical protein
MNKGRNKIEDRQKCIGQCGKELRLTDFYNTNNKIMFPNGKTSVCKNCLKELINYDDIRTVYEVLRQMDIPFLKDYWDKATENKGDTFGAYVRMANSLHQFRGLTWNNSVFELLHKGDIEEKYNIKTEDFKVTSDLILKWGDYSPEEIKAFERKYQMLKNNYQEKTAMHTEALLIYIRYRVKEEMATQKGDVREAKEWGALAQKAAQDAKINPSQLSKSDLSDGLDSFSQLVRSVEQAVDIIEILPKFKERPQDSVDMTIWCYINYIRDLKGLPLAEYKDIYAFVEERKKEYENMIGNEENDEL